MKKTTYLLIVALLLANILAGCSPLPESIMGPQACEVDVGGTMPLAFTILPEDVEDRTLTFSSSDETIVSVDDTGTARGIAPGSATVTATAENGVSAEVLITVTQPVESVSAEESLTLDIGLTGCVNAQIHPQEATDPALYYSSDDETVATVDEAGVVTALMAGEATITITAHNGQQAKTIIVVEAPVLEVDLDQESASIYIGEAHTITATVFPEDATHAALAWASSDEAVATVDDSGIVTAIAQGEAAITATSQNGVSASCLVSVTKHSTGGGSQGGGGSSNSSGASGAEDGITPGNNTPPSGGGTPPGDSGGTPPAPTQLTDAQIQQAINEAIGYAQGLGFTIVGERQPGHSIASVAYYDFDAFVQNLKDNVAYVASLADAGDDLSLVNLCFVREGNSVYVTYG